MKRQDVIDALVNQLGMISNEPVIVDDEEIPSGYDTNIGSNVQSFYELEIDEADDLPLVNVRETESSVEDQFQGLWSHSCNIEITIVDVGSIEYIRQCVNDVLKAIKSDKKIGGTCAGVTPGTIKIDKSEEKNKTIVAAVINIIVRYNTPEWEI